MAAVRYKKLDGIRGIAVLNMIAYHAVWDLVYIYNIKWNWYTSNGAYIWQQGICWTFIFLSGFCQALKRSGIKRFPLSKHPLKRGLIVFLGGAFITAATLALMPENRVVFGVLTLIGSCMVITGALEKWLQNFPKMFSAVISGALFFATRNINEGYLGFESIRIIKLPETLYSGIFMTYLGFTDKNFYSSDYFSLFPWIFLFMTGYFLCGYMDKRGILGIFEKGFFLPFEWIGCHSFEIYMLHQPLIYLVFYVCFSII